MSPASFDEELTFDTVAWWYRTDPCSTSAPVSVLGPWLLSPALTDLLHGITMTLCTTRPGLGFFLITSGMLVWGILACRMCADSMCAEAARKARLPHLRHRSVALVWKGTGELPHFSACLSAPQSLPKPLLPFHPLEKDLYPWHAALHWVTSLLLRVPTLPGLAGFSGSRFAGGSEAG